MVMGCLLETGEEIEGGGVFCVFELVIEWKSLCRSTAPS